MSQLPRLVLASASPRRRHLLKTLGLPFQVVPGDLDEAARPGEPPTQRAQRLALEKAEQVAGRLRLPAWVLGADTLVVAQECILEKPRDDQDAGEMLRLLSGCQHLVITGLSLVPAKLKDAQTWSGHSATKVTFAALDDRTIQWLLAGGEHRDKAGAYALQGRAAAFITSVEGTPSNVIGLPLDLTAQALAQVGYLPMSSTSRRATTPGPGSHRRT
jgi:septum formation protein